MTNLLVAVSVVVGLGVLVYSVLMIINTRRSFYADYIRRKRSGGKAI